MKKDLFGGGWNYRIFRLDDGMGPYFHIYEVYYDKKGMAHSWSAEEMHPHGESPNEVMQDLCLMQRAYFLPVMEVVSDEKGNEELVEISLNKENGKRTPTIPDKQ